MRKTGWLVAALAIGMLPVAARAQGGVYVEGGQTWLSGSTIGGNGTSPSGKASGLGATFGTFYDFYHLGPIGIGADARFAFSHNGDVTRYGNELNYGAANVRFDGVLPKLPVRPYAQAGILAASTNYAFYSAMRGGLGVGYQFGADVDLAPHLDFRVEYAGGQINDLRSRTGTNASLSFNSIQGGFVIWFGRE